MNAAQRPPPRYPMLHFPRWKVILVIAVALFGIVTALPNFLPSTAMQHWPSWLPQQQLRFQSGQTGGSGAVPATDRQVFQRDYLLALRKNMRT